MDEPVVTRPTERGRGRSIRQFRVTVIAGPATGARWEVPAERCAIGSHPSNDLVIDDPTVSRFHCELAIADGSVRVRDLGSRNGTLVDRVAIADGRIPNATTLVIGDSRIRVDLDSGVTEVAELERVSFGAIVGTSAAMRDVFAQLDKVAATDATVLVEGETGTGKEGIAEAIHDASARAASPFVVVDCSAIPVNLLEAELFGHEAGSFTGASERRIGVFEQASGGTVFLDEIGELPLDLQPKLLRVLEQREVRRVGGRSSIRCDLRIVAATNRDLRAEVNRATFRADLYFRLAVVKILLPPLRERAEDIPLLVPHLLRAIGASESAIAELTTPEFLAALSAASWTGNVRELRNHLEQCVVFGEQRLPGMARTSRPPPAIDTTLPYESARHQVIDRFERDYVTDLLARTDGNVAAAARAAGINRAYLHRLLRRHGLR